MDKLDLTTIIVTVDTPQDVLDQVLKQSRERTSWRMPRKSLKPQEWGVVEGWWRDPEFYSASAMDEKYRLEMLKQEGRPPFAIAFPPKPWEARVPVYVEIKQRKPYTRKVVVVARPEVEASKR